MQEIWLDSPYGKVFGQQTGPLAGPVVLGLHGWSQRNGWHTWQPLMQPLAEVGCRVVCVDMPGWGQSRPGPGTPLTTAQAVTTVQALLDSLQAATAVLLGESWGEETRLCEQAATTMLGLQPDLSQTIAEHTIDPVVAR